MRCVHARDTLMLIVNTHMPDSVPGVVVKQVNGQPACASDRLTAVLRGAWGFDGYITSDSDAIMNIWTDHKYVQTEAEAACVALRNGTCDVNSGKTFHQALLESVDQKLCSLTDVEAALFRTFKLRVELGLFDPIDDQPYWHVPLSSVGAPASQANSILAAQSSMVLLQNLNATLPLTPGGHVAVIGPHANATLMLLGNYLGQICPSDAYDCIKSPFQAIAEWNAGGITTSTLGCNVTDPNTTGFAAAIAAAQAADTIVLMMGIDGTVENEMLDRQSIDLPSVQHELVRAIVSAVGNASKQLVMVVFCGGGVDISPETNTIHAIVAAGYPGIYGADAVASTLFGTNEHLGGA
jgi:beta-D-xylosidase 4